MKSRSIFARVLVLFGWFWLGQQYVQYVSCLLSLTIIVKPFYIFNCPGGTMSGLCGRISASAPTTFSTVPSGKGEFWTLCANVCPRAGNHCQQSQPAFWQPATSLLCTPLPQGKYENILHSIVFFLLTPKPVVAHGCPSLSLVLEFSSC